MVLKCEIMLHSVTISNVWPVDAKRVNQSAHIKY